MSLSLSKLCVVNVRARSGSIQRMCKYMYIARPDLLFIIRRVVRENSLRRGRLHGFFFHLRFFNHGLSDGANACKWKFRGKCASIRQVNRKFHGSQFMLRDWLQYFMEISPGIGGSSEVKMATNGQGNDSCALGTLNLAGRCQRLGARAV